MPERKPHRPGELERGGAAGAGGGARPGRDDAGLAGLSLQNPRPVLRIGADGTVLYANPAGQQVIGDRGCEIGGQSPDTWRRIVAEVLASGSPGQVEVPQDGRVLCFDLVSERDGSSVNWYGQDVTDQKRAELMAGTQHDLALALGAAGRLEEGLRLCLGAALRASGLDGGGAHLVDEATGGLDLVCHLGLSEEFVECVRHFDATSNNTRVIAVGKPIYTRHGEPSPLLGLAERAEGIRCIGVLPVLHLGRVIGCIVVGSRVLDEVPPFARTALETIAARMGSEIARLRAEEELKQSRDFLHHMINALDDPVFVKDEERRWVLLNDAAVALMGRTREELLGRTDHDILPRDQADVLREIDDRVFRTGRTHVSEQQVRWQERLRTLSTKTSVFRDPATGRRLIAGTIRDVTDRKRAEEALKRGERLMRDTLNAIQDGVNILDGDLNIVRVNRALRDRHAHAVPLEGRKCYEVFQGRLQPCPGCPSIRAMREKGLCRAEMPLRDPQGRPKGWVELYAFPLMDEKGHVTGVVEYGRDVTGRRRAEEQQRESERKYQVVSENIPVVVYSALPDDQSTNQFVSGRIEELTGHTAREFVDDSTLFSSLLHPEDRDGVWKAVAEHRAKKGPLDIEYRVITRDGVVKWVRDNATPVLDEDGRIVRVDGFMEDVTDRKQAEARRRELEEQLRHSQKMEAIGRLAGGIAHDFNNKLAVGIAYCHLVLQDLPADSPLARPVEEILRANEGATKLTEQLLLFSRRREARPRPVDVGGLLRSIQDPLGRLLGEDIRLTMALPRAAGHAMIDPVHLEQVIMNLAVNARDAMPTGGALTIEAAEVDLTAPGADLPATRAPGPYVRLAVTDTGIGMDAEICRRAFEPFFTTKEVGEGTGLGLSTVYGIVEQAGGSIEVSSKPARGTTFTVYLPRVEAPPAADKAPAAGVHDDCGGETLLLVEDEEQVRQVAVLILEHCGYKVLQAANAQEALPLAEHYEGAIDLLVTDVVMPGMSGPELARCVTAARSKARVLFLSGHADGSMKEHGLSSADVNFLKKPFTPRDLARTVRRILDE